MGNLCKYAFGLLITASAYQYTIAADNSTLLKYDRPAKFFEESLVIGNGNLGAIIYGDTRIDRIPINDITLWTGEPMGKPFAPDAYKAIPEIRKALDKEDYKTADRLQLKVQGEYTENYQPLGAVSIKYVDHFGKKTSNYTRQLDLSNAIASSSYTINGYPMRTEYFASAPDSVIIVRMSTDDPAGINALISFDSQLPHSVISENNEISAEGYVAYRSYPVYVGGLENKFEYDPERGMRFRTLISASTDGGGKVTASAGQLKIAGAPSATLLITNATSFNGFDHDPATEGRPYRDIAKNRIAAASKLNFEQLKSRHTDDYKSFFDRVKLDLGTTAPEIASLPTDVQLKQYTDESQSNPDLEELYFNFGRYLLISSSRTMGVPANLQGLWNEMMLPPWSSNYTTNINLQENYWPAEVTNLPEMHKPLMAFINNLSKTGAETAKAYYGVQNGWSLSHNTDIWALTNPVGLHNGGTSWANWTMGGAWVATHIWDNYLFNKDIEELRKNYPALKGAAEFCLDWLIEKDGKLITSPSTSPENIYIAPDGYRGATLYGGTADLAMARQCLMDARDAAAELKTDKQLRKRIDETLKRLHPYSIGKKGNLQEWYYDWEDAEPTHRHQSHLFGLYPGRHITTEATPDLANAAKKTLEIKGDNSTGWSTGWRVNLYARLGDADNAYHIYRRLLRYISPDAYQGPDARRGGGTYPNMLDAHSPFQIDGNFGGTAGVAEMLIQSSPDDITLLPALPKQWADGSVSGLKARGNIVVDMDWTDGKVSKLQLSSPTGAKTTVKVNGKRKKVTIPAGKTISVSI